MGLPALCRNCEFDDSSRDSSMVSVLQCEQAHHNSIQDAVLQDERVHTVYFLNNLKSLLVQRIKVWSYFFCKTIISEPSIFLLCLTLCTIGAQTTKIIQCSSAFEPSDKDHIRTILLPLYFNMCTICLTFTQRGWKHCDSYSDPKPYTVAWYRMMRDASTRVSGEQSQVMASDPVSGFRAETLRIQLGLHPLDRAPTSQEERRAIEVAIKQTVREFDGLIIHQIMEFINDHCNVCDRNLAIGILSNSMHVLVCHACKARYDAGLIDGEYSSRTNV